MYTVVVSSSYPDDTEIARAELRFVQGKKGEGNDFPDMVKPCSCYRGYQREADYARAFASVKSI